LVSKTLELLKKFSDAANKNVLHPLDRERFLEFIVVSHREGEPTNPENIARELLREGWDEEDAERLADQYQNGRDLLQVYEKRR
jgi:hypothetical protein